MSIITSIVEIAGLDAAAGRFTRQLSGSLVFATAASAVNLLKAEREVERAQALPHGEGRDRVLGQRMARLREQEERLATFGALTYEAAITALAAGQNVNLGDEINRALARVIEGDNRPLPEQVQAARDAASTLLGGLNPDYVKAVQARGRKLVTAEDTAAQVYVRERENVALELIRGAVKAGEHNPAADEDLLPLRIREAVWRYAYTTVESMAAFAEADYQRARTPTRIVLKAADVSLLIAACQRIGTEANALALALEQEGDGTEAIDHGTATAIIAAQLGL